MPARRRRKRLRLTLRAATGAPRRRSRQTQYSDVSPRDPAIKKMLTCIKIRQKTKLLMVFLQPCRFAPGNLSFHRSRNLRPRFLLYSFLFRAGMFRPVTTRKKHMPCQWAEPDTLGGRACPRIRAHGKTLCRKGGCGYNPSMAAGRDAQRMALSLTPSAARPA